MNIRSNKKIKGQQGLITALGLPKASAAWDSLAFHSAKHESLRMTKSPMAKR